MEGDDEDDDSAPLLQNSVADNYGGTLNTRLKQLCVDVSLNEDGCRHSPGTSTENDTSGSSNDTSTETRKFSLWGLSSRKKFILASTCWCDLSTFMCLSVMAPFFPEEVSLVCISKFF